MSTNVYEPLGAARSLFKCRDPSILIEGPAGTGKTRAVLTKIRLAAEAYPGCRCLLFRKTRESMTETVMVEWENAVFSPGHEVTAGASRRTRQAYTFPNGSVVVLGGMDKPGKVMSSQYDMIAAFEATELTESDWEMASTRLRNGVMPYQQAIADCNPGAPTHWLNRRAQSGEMTRLLSRHEDNPRWWDGQRWTPEGDRYVNGTLAKLTGVRLVRLKHGLWAAAEGVVYDGWDPAVNVVDRFDIPSDWRRIRSIDFGYTNPFVCQWWAIDPDGRMYLYREIYRSGTLVSDHAKRIADLSVNEHIEMTVADHDAEDRATLHAAGIHTVPAKKDVQHGIQRVADRIRKAGDSRPRLFLLRDCNHERDQSLADRKLPTSTVEEFDGYVWARNASGQLMKELPVKEDDHGMDAMRYAVMAVDGGAAAFAAVVGGTITPTVPAGESIRAQYERLRADPDWGFDE